MRSLVKRASALAVVLALLISVGAAQNEPHYKELPNFHQVNEHLYRGGQPGDGGVQKLSELGIKTIVNLRGEDDNARGEQNQAEAKGLHYYSISMSGLNRPSDEQVASVMAIIADSKNWPVFIHCKRGSDRTGTIIGVYRISHDDWTSDRAITEAKHYGMSWIEFGMRDYIADYYRNQHRAAQSQASTRTTAGTAVKQ